MPTYTYHGPDRMFMDLRVGPDAQVAPADGDPPADGSTVELHAGDALTTTEPIEHPGLTESAAGAPAAPTAPAGRRPAPAASASTAQNEETATP